MSQSQGAGWGPAPGGQPAPLPPAGSWGPPPPGPVGYPTKYCHACGSAIDARAEDLYRCGVRQAGYASGPGKSRAIAAALALLLGNLGLHRFYLGDVALGFLYLIFFWTGIPGLIAWFEAIYFLTRSNEEWARQHGGPIQVPNAVGLGCRWILALWPLVLVALLAVLLYVGTQMSTILSTIGTEI